MEIFSFQDSDSNKSAFIENPSSPPNIQVALALDAGVVQAEPKQLADQAARTTGRYAAPAAVVDPKAPAAATSGPYAPK